MVHLLLTIASSAWIARLRNCAVLAIGLACVMQCGSEAFAQGLDCARLQAQIASFGHANSGKAAPFEQAAQKQRYEMDRTVAYARSIGCERRQFLFFGDPPPPQCGTIQAQIQRMRVNYDQLQAQAERAGGGPAADAQRHDLISRYNTYCGGATPQRGLSPPQQPKGFFETFFGGSQPQNEPSPSEQVPLENGTLPPSMTPDMRTARGGPKAVCVRLADGGFFPVSYSARRGALDELEDLCRVLCPNTEVKLYTYSLAGDIEQAVAIDGEVYTSLPNALKYQKTYDPAASCKPPGQSWEQALGEAEQRLGNRKDIVVTPQKAEELSRPKPDPKAKAKGEAQAPVAPKPADDPTAAEAAAAAQVPTASQDSAGISSGEAKAGVVVGPGQGQVREVTGPDGVKRKIRIILPTL